jgi:hypothetical protein
MQESLRAMRKGVVRKRRREIRVGKLIEGHFQEG